MQNENFNFYSPINLRSYNLEKTVKEQLQILGTLDNYFSILSEYEHAISIREDRIDKLYKEISIIIKLQKK